MGYNAYGAYIRKASTLNSITGVCNGVSEWCCKGVSDLGVAKVFQSGVANVFECGVCKGILDWYLQRCSYFEKHLKLKSEKCLKLKTEKCLKLKSENI